MHECLKGWRTTDKHMYYRCFSFREFLNSHHPGPRRAWKVGSEQHLHFGLLHGLRGFTGSVDSFAVAFDGIRTTSPHFMADYPVDSKAGESHSHKEVVITSWVP